METLYPFQQKAVDKIGRFIDKSDYLDNLAEYARSSQTAEDRELVDSAQNSYRIQLSAPTGAGKTVMIAHLNRLYLQGFVTIVMSPGAGDLEEQTYRRLSGILGGVVERITPVSFSAQAAAGCSYVGNWEQFVARDNKTGAYKNTIMKDGDARNFLDWIAQIGAQFLPVALIVDESHHGNQKSAGAIQAFLRDLEERLGYAPLYIEASATPLEHMGAKLVAVSLKEVQEAELVRKNIRLNGADLVEAINRMSLDRRANKPGEELMLDYALNLQERVDAAYIKHDAHEVVNGKKVYFHSLIGLQLPNGALGNEALARTEAYLRSKDITRENGKLVVFLNNDKSEGLKGIESAASPAQVLIYKQGIATGWDCPRAQILVGFRHITSKIFTKQNLGRFVRTTQRKYYDDDLLDYAYVISIISDLGQSTWGDEVDKQWAYEQESVPRVSEDGHAALSSFNTKKLSQSHYARVGRNALDPKEIARLWADQAAVDSLWDKLVWSPRSELDGIRLVAADFDQTTGALIEGTMQRSSQISQDDAAQKYAFEKLIENVMKQAGFEYHDSALSARYITNQIIRWYREAVLRAPDARYPHFGSLASFKDREKEARLGFGGTERDDREVSWGDMAVEQISLDRAHFRAVRLTLQRMLPQVTSGVLASEEQASSWSNRQEVTDMAFYVSPTQSIRTSVDLEHRVRSGLARYYAYVNPSSEHGAAYHEVGDLSGPEQDFESVMLASLIAEGGKRLSCFYKSPENKKTSYHVAVTGADGSQSNFYPDYLLELVDDEGQYSPLIIEVKSEAEVKAADPILLAKAWHLATLERKEGVRGGLAYQDSSRGGEWVLLVNREGQLEAVPAKEYLLE